MGCWSKGWCEEEVMQKVADSAGPSLEGTKADAVPSIRTLYALHDA